MYYGQGKVCEVRQAMQVRIFVNIWPSKNVYERNVSFLKLESLT